MSRLLQTSIPQLILRPIALVAISFAATALIASFLLRHQSPSPAEPAAMAAPRRSFILWLHGLGDSGPANEPIRTLFTSPEFRSAKWSFPSAPDSPVSCNCLLPSFLPSEWNGYGAQESFKETWCLFYEWLHAEHHNPLRWFDIPLAADQRSSCHEIERAIWCVDGAVMPSWFDIHEIPVSSESPKDEKGVIEAVHKVHAMIDKEVAAGINPENIFVCGFSQGGALTLASVLLYPRTLGGGAVFSGWVPFNSSIIERITAEARKTPILWSHGIADRTVLFAAGQAGPPFLEQAGMKCEFKAYPDLGHSISSEELKSLESWIKTHLQGS